MWPIFSGGENTNVMVSVPAPLPGLTQSPLLSNVLSLGPWRGQRFSPVSTLRKQVPCLPEGWGFCPESLLVPLRDKAVIMKRYCQYLSVLCVVTAAPSPRSPFRQFFSHLPRPPLYFNTTIDCIYVCIYWLSAGSQTIVLAKNFRIPSHQEPIFTTWRGNGMLPHGAGMAILITG